MSLRLECIRIYNFKSFKGHHTISEIDNHFTAIVGPNGSGKSNIIDSILFVLGFKAKKMRHAILKDLITAGSTECFVELVFNKFSISRSLKGKEDGSGVLKNVASKYEINGTEIGASEAIKYLKESGIDLENNRFLILQGEIESIAMMNPLELLEYIEDCIGSSAMKSEIESLETEIKNKQDELDYLTNSLKFQETDFLFKQGRKDEKLALLICKNESLVMKNRIVLVKNALAERKHISLMKEKERLETKLNELSNRNLKAINKIKEIERETACLEIKEKEDQLVQFKSEYDRIERENKAKDTRRKRIEKSLEKIEREIKENQLAIKNWEEESTSMKRNIEENNMEINKLEKEASQKIKELNKFDVIRKNEEGKSMIEKELLSCIEKKSILEVEMNNIAMIEEKIKHLEDKIIKIGAIKDVSGVKNKLIEEIRVVKNDMNATIQEINKRKHRAQEFEFIEQSYKREREVIESLQHIPGVFGVLKDLGVFDRKYNEAIDASTKALNGIVVDKTSTAEECIAIINRKKLNRTTFIIMDKLPESKDETSPVGELLYKKIKTEPKFIKCFYYALKDTLCVEDLETAKSLAFGKIRRRVVTIDGKLLEKSGIMSGGKVSKKLKSSAELEKIYTTMQKIFETKTSELEEHKSMEQQKTLLDSYNSQVHQLKKEVERKRSGFDKREMKIIEDKIEKLRNQLKDLQNSEIPIRASELKSNIQIINEKIDFLQRINQEMKIKLGNEPANCIKKLEKELQSLRKEYESIELEILPETRILKEYEEIYNQAHKTYTKHQSKINELRSKMGSDYHEEAECKTKIEETYTSLTDAIKIKESCALKLKEIEKDFILAKNLLNMIDTGIVFELDQALDFIEELDDIELKKKSREMIEELNQKEEANFKKIKEKVKDTEEDLETCRAVFVEYEASKKTYDEMRNSYDFLSTRLEKMKMDVEKLKSDRLSIFMNGFNLINKNIKEIFNLITFGGNAELDLLDYLNPFNDGIVLSVMPPKKAWKQISNLSGGEKTLSSLALIFALHKYRPSSFYIMDEIDAALDFKNVSVISQYLSHIDAQFIVISLRNDMFEMAKTLIGVYKVNDVSKALTVNLQNLIKV